MQPRGEVGRFDVEDQPSPPAEPYRSPNEMKYVSPFLTHWVGRGLADAEQYDLLLNKIVAKKELLFSHNPIPFSSKYGGLASKEAWGLEMVCFTDMPLSMSADHCKKYSKFAAVFRKSSIANCCVCPVAYTLNSFVSQAYSYLYHVGVGLEEIADGKALTKGKRAGEEFSLHKYMQHLHHFLAWIQDYSNQEFPYIEGKLESNDEHDAFFNDPSAFYYEREWRAVYRPGDTFPWVRLHDGRAYFGFSDSTLLFLVVPEAFRARAIHELSNVTFTGKAPEVKSFEDVLSGELG